MQASHRQPHKNAVICVYNYTAEGYNNRTVRLSSKGAVYFRRGRQNKPIIVLTWLTRGYLMNITVADLARPINNSYRHWHLGNELVLSLDEAPSEVGVRESWGLTAGWASEWCLGSGRRRALVQSETRIASWCFWLAPAVEVSGGY